MGYTRYLGLIEPVIGGKEIYATGMTHEVERCEKAIEFAASGKTVGVVSSGDAGIYGMAGLVLQLAHAHEPTKDLKIEIIPGVPAFVASASILGAPLMHDFASISLSDLLTDWEAIEERVEAAAKADFVIVLYNPKSTKRVEGLKKAMQIIRRHRKGSTPVGIVRNATREDQETALTTLERFADYNGKIDMLTMVLVGNSTTFESLGRLITPRGYKGI